MEKDELDYSIKKALRKEFDNSDKDRMIEIYRTCYQLSYYEEAEEMKSDIYADYNIKLD